MVSEPKKLKRKDISKGKNLSKVPKDEVLDHLPIYFQDRPSLLNGKIQTVNFGIDEAP